jgi:hypothetical protein
VNGTLSGCATTVVQRLIAGEKCRIRTDPRALEEARIAGLRLASKCSIAVRRALQLAAVVVFLAVLVILLTPADDGPVMELRGYQVSAAILFALLVLAPCSKFLVAQSQSVTLVGCGAPVGRGHSPAAIAPLRC